MFTSEHLLDLLIMGWLSNVPLGIGSIITLTVFFERLWKFRGLDAASRELASSVIDTLLKRDLDGARTQCEQSSLPIGKIFAEGLRWKNIALEDLERVLATQRAEVSHDMKRGVWMIGTTGSLAPFVGLFGTVIGIIRAFGDLAGEGGGGFSVVAASLSEALVATAAGLGVAIVALLFFNYLNTRIANISATYTRASERLVQALLFVESSSGEAAAE